MFVRINRVKIVRFLLVLFLINGWSSMQVAESFERKVPGKEAAVQDHEKEIINPGNIMPPDRGLERETTPIPDRWRLAKTLGLVKERWFDPYNHNILKADRPIHDDWFLNLNVIVDQVFEFRDIPTFVGPQTTKDAGSLDVFGNGDQRIQSHSLIFSAVYYKGNTVFRPPDYEYRFTMVANFNDVNVGEVRALTIDPGRGAHRFDSHLGVQDLYFDKHLRNVSNRFDFDSIRFGIQPINADFRGFLFLDNQLGVRLFGTRSNNIFQYNIAYFRRLEKDTNSGLNNLNQSLRDDEVWLANLYWQDFPKKGFISQVIVAHNRNDENGGNYFDDNGFLVRPASLGTERGRKYNATYFGYNGDGHFGAYNLSLSTYFLRGREENGVFVDFPIDIEAFFYAAELSRDVDWMRFRFTVVYASGDKDPFDNKAQGYDAIFENPLIAGADTSYWIRQPVANIGGGGVSLSGRNGLLNSLRSSKEQGQSNFTNPGIKLIGIGTDLDILPELRVSVNVNRLWFDDTSVLSVTRNQANIDSDIGWDISVAVIYRPLMSQNIVLRMSAALLDPGQGFADLFGDENRYSILGNFIITY